MNDVCNAWFNEHTAAAPPELLARARAYFTAARPDDLAARLAEAGEAALRAATAAGRARSAALDLLAADALITLALLATGEDRPDQLAGVAAELRRAASGTA